MLLQLLSPTDALIGVGKGVDVYLFLTGMMLLSEIARDEGLFDWLAAIATKRARGSPTRLFLFIYSVGTVVTIFLSNDATAVVLTPAVAAAVKTAKVQKPLPYLFICAFIANAASFVLPISNPANLVLYGAHVPSLLQWLPRFLPASALSIIATYAVLRWTQRRDLRQEITGDVEVPKLSSAGKTAALGLIATAIVLLTASAFDVRLGLPTAAAGALMAAVVFIRERKAPWTMLKAVSWSVLLLVAGLFVLVEALDETGLIRKIGALLQSEEHQSTLAAAWGAGIVIALASNLLNNLPAGLDRCGNCASRACAKCGDKRRSDRRRSRFEPLGDGIARDDSLADGVAPGGRASRRRRLPQDRRAGHAARAYPRAWRRMVAGMSA